MEYEKETASNIGDAALASLTLASVCGERAIAAQHCTLVNLLKRRLSERSWGMNLMVMDFVGL